MLVTPQDVTKFTPRLSPRAEQYEGTRLVFRIGPRSLVAFEELLQGLPAKVSPIDSPVLRAHLAFLAEKYLPLPAVLTH